MEEKGLFLGIDDSLNMISGIVSAPFWDTIYNAADYDTVIAIKDVIQTLSDTGKPEKAMRLVKAIHVLMIVEYPIEMETIEQKSELISSFIAEFLLDADDIISEYIE